jgi:hypothetical protein
MPVVYFSRFRKYVKESDISYAKKYDRKKSNNFLPRKSDTKIEHFLLPKYDILYDEKIHQKKSYSGIFLENSPPENTPENS